MFCECCIKQHPRSCITEEGLSFIDCGKAADEDFVMTFDVIGWQHHPSKEALLTGLSAHRHVTAWMCDSNGCRTHSDSYQVPQVHIGTRFRGLSLALDDSKSI